MALASVPDFRAFSGSTQVDRSGITQGASPCRDTRHPRKIPFPLARAAVEDKRGICNSPDLRAFPLDLFGEERYPFSGEEPCLPHLFFDPPEGTEVKWNRMKQKPTPLTRVKR